MYFNQTKYTAQECNAYLVYMGLHSSTKLISKQLFSKQKSQQDSSADKGTCYQA